MEISILDRLHDRYHLPLCAGIKATIAGESYRVLCLGYGGMAIEVLEDQVLPETELQIVLDVLGFEFECPGEIRFRKGAQVGLRFAFKHIAQLDRLKNIIPWLALGAKLADGQAKDAFYRCRMAANGTINLLVEFKAGAVTGQLRSTDGVLATWHDLGAGGELVDMRLTDGLDESLARCGLLLLTGVLSRRGFDRTLEAALHNGLKAFHEVTLRLVLAV